MQIRRFAIPDKIYFLRLLLFFFKLASLNNIFRLKCVLLLQDEVCSKITQRYFKQSVFMQYSQLLIIMKEDLLDSLLFFFREIGYYIRRRNDMYKNLRNLLQYVVEYVSKYIL